MAETTGVTETDDPTPAPRGLVRRVWAFRISVALFSLWLAWLAFVALGRMSG